MERQEVVTRQREQSSTEQRQDGYFDAKRLGTGHVERDLEDGRTEVLLGSAGSRRNPTSGETNSTPSRLPSSLERWSHTTKCRAQILNSGVFFMDGKRGAGCFGHGITPVHKFRLIDTMMATRAHAVCTGHLRQSE